MATILGQRCVVFLDEAGIQRFKIDSSIDAVLAGDLPIYGPSPFTSNVFVHKITNPLDPKSDVFLRVGNVADLTTLALGRETAVGLNQPLYLSTTFTVTYDDIATASSAKVLIQQRVDNLIADWHTYNEQFLAPLSVPPDLSNIPLPLTTSIVSERQDAYNTAHAELLAAKGVSAEAAATATAANAHATECNENAINSVAESQQISNLLGQYNGIDTAIDAYRSTVTAFAPSAQTFEDASLVFSNASAAFQTENATFAFAVATYLALGPSPGAGPLVTVTAAKVQWDAAVLTWNNAVTAWNFVRASFNASGLNAAIAAEAIAGEPVMNTFQTAMAELATQKIADVAVAASKKTDCDKEAAEATTAKKAADEAQSAANLADVQAFLSLQEVCPDAEPIVP